MADILVTAKINPDLDATACILAYSDLLTRSGVIADGLIFGSPQSEVQYFINYHKINIPTVLPEYKKDWTKYILVDMSAMKGAPPVVSRDQVIEIIDHREGIEDFPNAKIQNELIGAAATLVTERFMASSLQPNPNHAKLLFGAIYHNTLNLTSSNTSNRDIQAAGYLRERFGLDLNLIADMFKYTTEMVLHDISQAISSDAKEFSLFAKNSIGAFQLVVWDFSPDKYSSEIEKCVLELEVKLNCTWSFLTVADVSQKVNHIYAHSQVAKTYLNKALGADFTGDWATLKPMLLRKQIMPKIKNVVTSVPK